jgi:hypothetical protein
VSIKASLLAGSASANVIYEETHSIATNEFGIASLNIGQGTTLSGTFATIDWGANTYYLKIDLDVSGGSNYVFMGTTQLLSVPYAMYAIPHMIEQGKGTIVNVASFVAHMGAATPQIAYTASKGAVLAMTREIAVTYARKGIRANALCPGPVMTPLLEAFLDNDAKRNRRLVHIPMGRFGEPEEIANGALFLASDESSWMTGQSLIIDGGITAAYVTPE